MRSIRTQIKKRKREFRVLSSKERVLESIAKIRAQKAEECRSVVLAWRSRAPHAVQNPARKDNSRKCPQTPYPYWRSITHCSHEQLSNQNCGKEEKPRICEKDTIERRKEGTMKENRAMVNVWG